MCPDRAGGDDSEKKQLSVLSFGVVAVQAIMSFAAGNWGFVEWQRKIEMIAGYQVIILLLGTDVK